MPNNQSPWLRIGWRNLGRNRKRTTLTALGLAVGFTACIFVVGWSDGFVVQMVESATSLVNGQVEIHDADFRPDRGLYDTIGGRDGVDVEAWLQAIDADQSVVAAAPRVYTGGMVSSGEATSAGLFMGIDPVRELALTRFLENLAEGRLPTAGENELLVGVEMARQLSASLGDELVVVTSGADGSMANDLYTLVGIFNSGLQEIDVTYVVMPIHDLQTLVVLPPGRIHEIAVATANPNLAEPTAARLFDTLPPVTAPIEVVPWTVLNPAMVEYVALASGVYFVIVLLVFGVAMFGVANSMLMATYERRREFAVMLALGATPRSVWAVVLSEGLAIGVVSLTLSVMLALPMTFWLANWPPDLSGLLGTDVTLLGALLTPSLQVTFHPQSWVLSAGALLVTALASALYPAFRAGRVPPADTLSGI